MKIYSRSSWTALHPKINTGAEDTDGLPNFRRPVGICVSTPDISTIFQERNPVAFFNLLFKEDTSKRGYGDISPNLGIAPNTDGVYCLRGLTNKGASISSKLNSDFISILCLLGNEEQPTDLLLNNLLNARELVLAVYPEATEIIGLYQLTRSDTPKEPLRSLLKNDDFWDMKPRKESVQFDCGLPTVFQDTTSVHTFELIEHLNFWGYYSGRNDGVYGSITYQAVRNLQADLAEGSFYRKRIDGFYGRYTREAWCNFMKQSRSIPELVSGNSKLVS